MILQPIEKRSGVTRKEFIENYLKPRRPLVFTDLASDWNATQKWSFDFFKEKYGKIQVPVIDKDFHKAGKGYMCVKKIMPFGEYLDLIQKEPTDLRLFAFSLFKYAPDLLNDLKIHTIMGGFVKEIPMMFFGGQGSFTPMHYDIDYPEVFLTQFCTQKKVILFGPEQSHFLYQHPFTVQSPIDVLNPNYEKYPAFKNVEGLETVIEHGETLYIPSTYWHYIYYMEGGFSISLRAYAGLGSVVKGVGNLARHFVVDKSMNALFGSKWKGFKEDLAQRRAETALAI
jgi:Cupin-like domain